MDNVSIDVIIITGGTGITGRDVTPEAIKKVKDKDIPGFGEIFRYLSYKKIGTSSIQSRASACIAKKHLFLVCQDLRVHAKMHGRVL